MATLKFIKLAFSLGGTLKSCCDKLRAKSKTFYVNSAIDEAYVKFSFDLKDIYKRIVKIGVKMKVKQFLL